MRSWFLRRVMWFCLGASSLLNWAGFGLVGLAHDCAQAAKRARCKQLGVPYDGPMLPKPERAPVRW